MRFQVRVHGVETGFDCARSESVLAAMGQAGARGLTVGCRNGGCGVCRVQVLAGDYETGQMSAAQISADDHARGVDRKSVV
jgi:ferredoxin